MDRATRISGGMAMIAAAIAVAGITPPTADAAVFSNTNPITIPSSGTGSPYPSTINVPALGGNVVSVAVTLNGFSHTFPDDVGVVLVGPTGAALVLQNGAGDGTDAVNLTYTLSDSGAGYLPTAGIWGPGTYLPTSYYTGDVFPPPGPGTSYGNPGPAGGGTATFASVFGGTNPTGNWSLYVVDFVGGDQGEFSGGWSIDVTVPEPASLSLLALGAAGLLRRRSKVA